MFVLNMPLLHFRVVFATLDDGGTEKKSSMQGRPEQAIHLEKQISTW